MTRKFVSSLGTGMVLFLAGCSMEGLDKTVSGIIKPVVKPASSPTLAAARQREAQAGTSACAARHEDTVLLDIDVDTAYVRLKRHFRYKTLEERKRSSGGWVDQGFRHETTPGARYWMKDGVSLEVDGRTLRGWLSMEIERDGQGSIAYLRYCVGGIQGFDAGPDFPGKLTSLVKRVAERR